MDSLLTIIYKRNHAEIALNLIWCSIMMVLLYFTTSAANLSSLYAKINGEHFTNIHRT